MQGLMGVAGQITDAKQGGGLLGMAKNAVTGSPIGQYFGGIRAAAGNVANTTIGSKIAGFGKGTIGVSKEILAGIAGPEGLGLTNLVSGAKGLAQNGAGWVAGKAGNVISTVANSGVGQAIGGAAGRVGGVAKGVVSVGSNALGALGNFAGAGAGLLGSVWGPAAGGFGSLFAGLTAGAGVGLAVLWRANPSWKQNLFITGLTWACGAFLGVAMQVVVALVG